MRADGSEVRRLLLVTSALLALVPVAGAGAAAAQQASWAAPQIGVVTAAGLMGATDAASFHPDDPLTAQALENLVFDLKQRIAPLEAPVPAPYGPSGFPATTTTTTTTTTIAATTPTAPKQVADPTRPVTMAQLDGRLVAALGLSQAAVTFARNARSAGLKVPSRFGTEVVARLLGLRLNHPASQDALELRPGDPATRAEAAYSA